MPARGAHTDSRGDGPKPIDNGRTEVVNDSKVAWLKPTNRAGGEFRFGKREQKETKETKNAMDLSIFVFFVAFCS